MSDTCEPRFIVIGTAINQLETKVSLKTICCLKLFVVVYKHVYNVLSSEVVVGDMYTKSRCHRHHR